MENILVVEDTESLREVLSSYLQSEGFEVAEAASAEEALELMQSNDFSLILSDLKLPNLGGLELLRESKKTKKTIPVIVMTAYGTIDIAVEAVKLGAADFITKPFDPTKVSSLINEVISEQRTLNSQTGLQRRRSRSIVTQSPLMEDLLAQARKVASLRSPVLLLGESGTGKEMFARYIHEHSPRANEVFVGVNCASMPQELLESEFFGHEAGAFTGATDTRVGLFEQASDGTIFLDEIGTMPLELQTKLLRTLQESEVKRVGSTEIQKVNTRVISATNCSIEKAIEESTFREDLYYRLSVVVLEIPPLRKRKEDIPLLAKYFVKKFSKAFGKDPEPLPAAVLEKLSNYDWPGNVRELENVIERAMIFSEGVIREDSIEISEVPSACLTNSGSRKTLANVAKDAAKIAEIEAIEIALRESGGNKSKAARVLQVSYKTLLNKMKEYDI